MKKKQTYYLDADTIININGLSKKTRVPASQYVQEALEDLLKKYESEVKKTNEQSN